MRRIQIVMFVCSVFLAVASICGAMSVEDESKMALEELSRVDVLLKRIVPFVERLDIARIHIIRKRVETVRESVEKCGLAHAATMRAYQHLIVVLRYSTAFFKSIESHNTSKQIAEILQIYEDISKARGFDDTPYTQITASVFTELHAHFGHLSNIANLPEELQKKVQDLVKPLGEVIAIAKQGDRPKTFAAAEPVHRQIIALYPDFNLIQHSNAAFDIILEIHGLNEFYAEYAQIGD